MCWHSLLLVKVRESELWEALQSTYNVCIGTMRLTR